MLDTKLELFICLLSVSLGWAEKALEVRAQNPISKLKGVSHLTDSYFMTLRNREEDEAREERHAGRCFLPSVKIIKLITSGQQEPFSHSHVRPRCRILGPKTLPDAVPLARTERKGLQR